MGVKISCMARPIFPPGMTMVFQIKDPIMLEKVKVGDKVKFSVEKLNGALVVTDMQAAR